MPIDTSGPFQDEEIPPFARCQQTVELLPKYKNLANSGRGFVIPIAASEEPGNPRLSEFKALLLDVLGTLANCAAGRLEHEVETVFRKSCQFLEIQRGGLWYHSGQPARTLAFQFQGLEKQLLAARVSWPFPPGFGTDSETCFPWISAQLKAGRTVLFRSLAELPPEADQDKQALTKTGLESLLLVPLHANGLQAGALSCALSRNQGLGLGLLKERVQLVAQVLADGIERKLKEEQLREFLTEARQYKSALEAYAPLSVTDAQGKISYVNDKFCELFKYSHKELVGQNHRILNSGYHSKEFFSELWATITRCEAWRGEFKNRAKDGSFCWVAAMIVPLRNEHGKPSGYISILSDITERKLAQEALEKSYGEIKELKNRLQAESDYLRFEMKLQQSHGEIIGRSPAIKRVLRLVEQVAPVDCSVLISGETGTGKELIARGIHRLSSRKDRMMVVVNCAAFPAALVESELFGRERGAYTGALTSEIGRFELADGGTIFLDEIGELSMDIQAKLLRVLQNGEFQRLGNPKTRKVNVRLIAATNKDLAGEVRAGRFREDLYYRLRVFPILVPPLRERMQDLSLLISAFVEEFSRRMSKQITRLPHKVLESLERHSWPGNIRELRNVIERAVILSSGETLIVPTLTDCTETSATPTSLAQFEREHIVKTLEEACWRIKGPYGAAKRLQLKPSTLYSKMAKLGINRSRASFP